MIRQALTVALATSVTVTGFALTAPSAHAVMGGRIDSTPWVVKMYIDRADGSFACTGSALSEEWILTAQHCTREDDKTGHDHTITVIPDYRRGAAQREYAVDRYYNLPGADIALVHLRDKLVLNQYGKLVEGTFNAPVTEDVKGRVYGYGATGYDASGRAIWGDRRKSAQVDLVKNWKRYDEYNALGIMIKGDDGSAQPGDSGGPLTVNGKIVGVASKLDSVPPRVARSTKATGVYTNVSLVLPWIARTTGLPVVSPTPTAVVTDRSTVGQIG